MPTPPPFTIYHFSTYNKDDNIGAGNPASCFEDSDIRNCVPEELTDATRVSVDVKKAWEKFGTILTYLKPASGSGAARTKVYPQQIELVNDSGTYGSIYEITFDVGGTTPKSAKVLMKVYRPDNYRDQFKSRVDFENYMEEFTDARRSMETASWLRRCDLVRFKFFVVYKTDPVFTAIPRLFTIMDQLDSDCFALDWTEREKSEEQEKFGQFLVNLKECIFRQEGRNMGSWYSDMKLANCGTKLCSDGQRRYFLIDIDGMNDPIATYPIVKEWTTFETLRDADLREAGKLATRYAFAVTAVLFCKDQTGKIGQTLYHHLKVENIRSVPAGAENLKMRLKDLSDGIERYPKSIRALIEDATSKIGEWARNSYPLTAPKRTASSADHIANPP